MSAESRGTATLDGPKYLQLLIAAAGLESVLGTGCATHEKDVCRLEGRSDHRLSVRRKARRLSSTFDRRKIFERVVHLLQMLLRKMEILRSSLEISVSEQDLDGAQVGSGFKKVGRETVAPIYHAK